jgi:hypothetical protein
MLHTIPNTYWRPIFWEPVSGTGERLMVGVVVDRENKVSAHRIIRDDVLDCLYGKAANGARTLIDTGLDALKSLSEISSLQSDLPTVFGLEPGPLRHIYAPNMTETLRISALLYSSLANMDRLDAMESTDAPTQEDVNRRFSTEVKELVIGMRPDLSPYFGRQAVLIEDGEPVKFGFCSPNVILHFGVLSPVRQSGGVRDARARMWELDRAREWTSIKTAALLFAVPRENDPTLSSRQQEAARRNAHEISREADGHGILFKTVTEVERGASELIALA